MALSDAEVVAAMGTERTAWNAVPGNYQGIGIPAGVRDSLDHADLRLRTTLVQCVQDAARRCEAAQGLTWDPQRTTETFVAAAVRLAVLAVASPSAQDTRHLQTAGLA
jgi:hypothetical protein